MDSDSGGDRLYADPELAQFYDLENGWDADTEYCFALAQDAASVLDLGCGTGLLLARLGAGRRAVGVDPAAAMLDVARARPGGDRVTWLAGDARSLRLDQGFDLVVLTGHAFQVFLGDDDQRSVLATIARHLTPAGRFIFDSRNPAARAWLTWTPEASRRVLQHPDLGAVAAWNEAEHDPGTDIVTYRTHYQIVSNQQQYAAASRIRFTAQARLAVLIDAAGLAVDRWLGDWQGSAWTPESPEIIPLGRLR